MWTFGRDFLDGQTDFVDCERIKCRVQSPDTVYTARRVCVCHALAIKLRAILAVPYKIRVLGGCWAANCSAVKKLSAICIGVKKEAPASPIHLAQLSTITRATNLFVGKVLLGSFQAHALDS